MSPITDHKSDSRVDLDTVFRSLSHTVRRQILVEIMTKNPRQEIEFETVETQPETDREQMAMQLHHTHLPKLDEAGFIDWDRETGTVTRGEDFEEILPLLKLMDDHREELPDEWP